MARVLQGGVISISVQVCGFQEAWNWGSYELAFVREGWARSWEAGCIDATWLNLGMLSFTCDKGKNVEKIGTKTRTS